MDKRSEQEWISQKRKSKWTINIKVDRDSTFIRNQWNVEKTTKTGYYTSIIPVNIFFKKGQHHWRD